MVTVGRGHRWKGRNLEVQWEMKQGGASSDHGQDSRTLEIFSSQQTFDKQQTNMISKHNQPSCVNLRLDDMTGSDGLAASPSSPSTTNVKGIGRPRSGPFISGQQHSFGVFQFGVFQALTNTSRSLCRVFDRWSYCLTRICGWKGMSCASYFHERGA
jgi:hypothetical protein